MAYHTPCVGMLPDKAVVRVALCQEGRCPRDKTDLAMEASYFRTMFNYGKHMNEPGIEVICYEGTFGQDQDPECLNETDIFYMTGFSPCQGMAESLKAVFRTHHEMWDVEVDDPPLTETLFRKIIELNMTRTCRLRIARPV